MNISFHGAARTVTGTKHVVTFKDGTLVLLDCGLFQGLGQKTAELNEQFGFDAAAISFVLLSHAHIDHSGLLPKLVKEGFKGTIYCTEATRELAEILLLDSAEIQEHEASFQNKARKDQDLPLYEPLYLVEDVQAAMQLFDVIEYDNAFELTPDISVLFSNAGHLIGSASIHITAKENGKTTTLLFSGDVGRYRSTLLQSPAIFPQADYIILESTYGNSTHNPIFNSVDPLLEMIKKTCLQKKGKLIIPAFSVGRTQEVLYALNQLELEKRLPELSYFVDSPLSKKATTVIKHHMGQFNDRLQDILKKDDDPFDFAGLKYVETADDSRTLAEYKEPCVIISASGTADAGRVKHHIFSVVQEDHHTILFVGYCQENSIGGQLLRGAKMIELFGEACEVAAEINSLSSMSAHGDFDDLAKFISCQDVESVKRIFLVHGEYATQQAFATRLERKGFTDIAIPAMHESFEL